MNLFGIKNIDLIAFMENATELFALGRYKNKKLVENYIGLVTHRSNFYGSLDSNNETLSLNTNVTVFDSVLDITLIIEGPVVLNTIPVNNGSGDIIYIGYGILKVDDVVIYDGRTHKYLDTIIYDDEHIVTEEEDGETSFVIGTDKIDSIVLLSIEGSNQPKTNLILNENQNGEVGNLPLLNTGETILTLYRKSI